MNTITKILIFVSMSSIALLIVVYLMKHLNTPTTINRVKANQANSVSSFNFFPGGVQAPT